jgi:polyisoprenoid-binding protein YceI
MTGRVADMKTRYSLASCLAALTLFGIVQANLLAQAPGPRGGRAGAPPPDPTRPARIELVEGTVARYKVREQLAGISFPSDAVGTTTAVTGGLVLNPDGSIDVKQSRIVVDLKALMSDQSMRDGYVQRNTLETEKFPTLEFVPTRTAGLSMPLPSAPPAQAGFQLIGDMTLHGVTREVTWNVVATFGNDAIAGRATTTLTFEMFKIEKPSLARLLSVDDEIELEIEFRSRRTAL